MRVGLGNVPQLCAAVLIPSAPGSVPDEQVASSRPPQHIFVVEVPEEGDDLLPLWDLLFSDPIATEGDVHLVLFGTQLLKPVMFKIGTVDKSNFFRILN